MSDDRTRGISPECESRIFESANALLAQRRALIERRKRRWPELSARFQKSAQTGLLSPWSAVVRWFVLQPAMQAATVLILIAMIFAGKNGMSRSSSQLELPDNSKYNDAPLRYDAERTAEEQAYEQEVEDARGQQAETN